MAQNTVLFRQVEAPACSDTKRAAVVPARPSRTLQCRAGCGTDIAPSGIKGKPQFSKGVKYL
ncbi:hypothetical protein [Phocaeicola dorei]|uniref:Uncharacterized protein n=1 Tax=Phocaeicola dorei TaxID=357276 RepID=A0A5M5ZP70_9BACT|nr:hypothetical protein [Phocaeicola dorei]KAA5379569.1 hypothetical protein F2Y61_20480 [Phocaeicola dorei]